MRTLKGKIILVDKDKYEKDLLEKALSKKLWEAKVEYFSDPIKALSYLKETEDDIFIVISDMNMVKLNGLEFKKTIDNDPVLRKKSIPFIFATLSATKTQVTDAFDYRVQGYFKKPLTVEEQAGILDVIIRYWIICLHPNKEENFEFA